MKPTPIILFLLLAMVFGCQQEATYDTWQHYKGSKACIQYSSLAQINKSNGDLLWETDLPNPAFATPAIYQMNGKQYVVIACGGGKLKTPSGDSYVAFVLP